MRFFSEQSAPAIQSLNAELKTKPSLLLNMEGMTINERSFTVRVSAASESGEADGERGRRPLMVWKEQSDQLNLNTIWNVLELEETMGLDDPGRLPSSSTIKFSWEERRASG